MLVNDVNTAGSINGYRVVTVQPTPAIKVVNEGGVVKVYYTGTLRAATTVDGTYQAVAGASSPYTVPTSAALRMFYRSSN